MCGVARLNVFFCRLNVFGRRAGLQTRAEADFRIRGESAKAGGFEVRSEGVVKNEKSPGR